MIARRASYFVNLGKRVPLPQPVCVLGIVTERRGSRRIGYDATGFVELARPSSHSFRSIAMMESGGNGSEESTKRKIGVNIFNNRICHNPNVFRCRTRPFSHHAGTPGRLNLTTRSTRKPACSATLT